MTDDIPAAFDALEPGDTIQIAYSIPQGTAAASAIYRGVDEDYNAGEYDPSGPRHELEDPSRDDRDFAAYPAAYSDGGPIKGVYSGERSPEEMRLGTIEDVEVLDEADD